MFLGSSDRKTFIDLLKAKKLWFFIIRRVGFGFVSGPGTVDTNVNNTNLYCAKLGQILHKATLV
jgi:hypothetical protein